MHNIAVPTIFAIDTAGERCCLVLTHGAEVHTLLGEPQFAHLEQVMPMIDRLFANAQLRPEDCDAFGFGSGPGSFTGLRVACTIVQGLALATNRPVIAVGNLLLLAAAAHKGGLRPPGAGARSRILAAIDARMQQAYWAVYDYSDGAWSEAVPPSLCEATSLQEAVSVWQPTGCAGNAAWLQRHVGQAPSTRLCDVAVESAVLAQMVQEKFFRGELIAPEQALPAYVRDRVALTVSERRASTLGARS